MSQAPISCNMDRSHPAYNTDWVFAGVNREHGAQHRDWFSTYTPISSEVETILGARLPVVGIGTVHLPLQTRREGNEFVPTRKQKKRMMMESNNNNNDGGEASNNNNNTSSSSSSNISILILPNVLHVPSLPYNVVSALKLDAGGVYSIHGMTDMATSKEKKTGALVGFTELVPFMPKFRLAGQEEGMSTVDDKRTRPQTFEWLRRERELWTRVLS